ncbi:hypothetical protein PF005_g5897 [Phytophthora fragariae]|uniref:Uncharacterized protein n=1 Tax=Phytophthora fragariae TaxID=53985 RepID=A0A6A3TV34_9STRA|nr:hypothetical protein PF003_g13429 [Phytophthora fragariae]KAE8943881.1 hypothetical protein PF009_g6407 [Phytophthora fragariae]KAE9020829.1 hypothetical protein PF011_g5210 [Phytophthora fragariae]KAE9130006.1 hypothetical protein PF010_g3996 [Phytophthora fragariae]KAE9137597.1 hypothetical protein PF007_g1717 [Phytophthora fragariae]
MTREALDMSLTTRQVFTAANVMATSAPSEGLEGVPRGEAHKGRDRLTTDA